MVLPFSWLKFLEDGVPLMPCGAERAAGVAAGEGGISLGIPEVIPGEAASPQEPSQTFRAC